MPVARARNAYRENIRRSSRHPVLFHRRCGIDEGLRNKDGCTNLEMLGVGRMQIGTAMRDLRRMQTQESIGFWTVPANIQLELEHNVTNLIRLSPNAEIDHLEKIDRAITSGDIARRAAHLTFVGNEDGCRLSTEQATREIWGRFDRSFTSPERRFTKRYSRIGNLGHLRANLQDVLTKVTVAAHGYALTNIVYAAAELRSGVAMEDLAGVANQEFTEYARAAQRLISQGERLRRFIASEWGHLSRREVDELIRIGEQAQHRSTQDLRHNTRLTACERELSELEGQLGVLEARAMGAVGSEELAQILTERHALEGRRGRAMTEVMEVSGQRFCRGEWFTAGSVYRHGDEVPELFCARTRTLSELVEWGTSISKRPDYKLDKGVWYEYSAVMRRMALIVDHEVPLRGPSAPCLFREHDFAAGGRFREGRLEAVADMIGVLQAAEVRGEPIINYTDPSRFYMPKRELIEADELSNDDTDNIFYREWADLAGIFGFHNGVFVHPQRMFQAFENYVPEWKSVYVMTQEERDSYVGETAGPINAQRIDNRPWTVRSRLQKEAFTGSICGYANGQTIDSMMRTQEYVERLNMLDSSYYGQYLLDRWTGGRVSKGEESTLIANRAAHLLGRPHAWDVLMSVDRGIKYLMAASLVSLGVHTLGFALFGVGAFVVPPALVSGLALGGAAYVVFKLAVGVTAQTIKLNQWYREVALYRPDPSEDYLFTTLLLKKYMEIISVKGFYQENDAMNNIGTDMAQKLRWIASNAALMPVIAGYLIRNRHSITGRQAQDLFSTALYNFFPIPKMFNMYALLAFLFTGSATIVMPALDLYVVPGQNVLSWLIELSLLNYAMIETLIRYGYRHRGCSSEGATLNAGYEREKVDHAFLNVGRRAISRVASTFGSSAAYEIPIKTRRWGSSETDGASFFLRKNAVTMGVLGLGLYRVVTGHLVGDAIGHGDIISLGYASLITWLGVDLGYYYVSQFRLNKGIPPLDEEHRFEREEGINL
ncbi:MAG: hypothetical protein ABIH76_05360 [Candidatus Bathyarchaeota archaeon]